MIQKTLLNIEGISRELYPQLDLWATAKPFFEKWMKQQIGISGFVKRVKQQLPNLSERLPEIPELIYHYLKNQSHVSTHVPKTVTPIAPTKFTSRWRSFFVGIGAGLLILGGTTLLQHTSRQWLDHFIISHVCSLAIIGLLCLILGLWRTHR